MATSLSQEQAMRLLFSSRQLTIESLLEIENKERQLVPFILNPIQADMLNNSFWRDIYVKPAQVGATSIHEADFYLDNITINGTVSVIISYDEISAQRLLLKTKKFHRSLERRIPSVPRLDHKSSTEMTWENKDTNFYSAMYIFSARSYTLGRGEAIHNLLLDEHGFWPLGTHEAVFASAVQRVPLKAGTKVRIQCYSSDTDILTKRGWIKFPELLDSDEVLTKDPETGYAYYTKSSAIYEYDYDGDMISLAGKRLDLLVTPEHKLWVKSRTSGYGSNYKFRAANSLTKSGALFDTSMKWYGEETESFTLPGTDYKIPMNTWIEFLGYFLSEGSVDRGYGVRLGQSAGSQHWFDMFNSANAIAKCLGTEVIESMFKTDYKDMLVYIVRNKGLRNYLSDYTLPKRLPDEIRFLSPKYLKLLIWAFSKGDGSSYRNCLFNTSKELLDGLQEILLKLGYSTNLYPHKGTREDRWKTEYALTWNESSNVSLRHKEPELVAYSGKVYCAEVPFHLLMVRRNGKAVWCGNSTANGEANPFCEMYRAAKEGTSVSGSVYRPHFYTWYAHPEYVMYPDDVFCLPGDDAEILHNLDSDELILMRLFTEHLGIDEQLAMAKLRWRRYKRAEMASLYRTGETVLLFSQEFPEDDETCFISAGGQAYNIDIINTKIRECYPAPQHMNLVNEKTGASATLEIWHDKEEGRGYIVGIDPGKGKTSESVAAVWTFLEGYRDKDGNDVPPEMKHYATLAGFYDEWEMAIYCKQVGYYFNNAVLAPEDNLDIVSHLRDYPDIYMREDLRSGKLQKIFGWQSNVKTKPYMITEVSRHLEYLDCHDIRFWSQCKNIRRDANTRSGVSVVGADDHHDASAIAVVCRDAQTIARGFVGVAGWPDDWGR